MSHTNLQTLQLRFEILTTACYFNNLGFNIFNLHDAQPQYKPPYLLRMLHKKVWDSAILTKL